LRTRDGTVHRVVAPRGKAEQERKGEPPQTHALRRGAGADAPPHDLLARLVPGSNTLAP
jgi:hypothetical protein